MEKIVTAEEWLNLHCKPDDWSASSECLHDGLFTNNVINYMNEFAKLYARHHVKAALKAASENAVAKEDPADYGTGEIWVDEKSILNAYPLDNIK